MYHFIYYIYTSNFLFFFFFFFQAEDGIRDFHVTGVQTCALPISLGPMYRQHGSPSTCAAILRKIGAMTSHDSREPPGMSEGPLSAPSSPPETPIPTK